MRSRKGFTMVEMIIVIAIIAVLAMVVIPAISGYMEESDKDYNKKLVSQLEISGKNYYSENKNELPNKEYNRIALISNTYVALPTLQSGNYVSKDFVDSRGVECKESYVYVMQPGGSTENEYHPCLICGDKNYTEDDPYCNISNWDDESNPNCNLAGSIGVDSKTKVVDGENGKKIFYNPTSITITATDESGAAGKPGKIAYIIIEAYANGTNKKIDEITIDVSKMTSSEIKTLNIMNYFPKKNDQIITAEYRIKVLDEGGNNSTCLINPGDNPDNGSTITVIYDKTKPNCELIDVQKNKDEKYITFDMNKTKDDWSTQDKLQVLIDETNNKNQSYVINKLNGYKYSLKGKPDGTYYGYVKDEAGNMKICDISVKIKMFEDEKPYCLLSSDSNVYHYVKRDGKTIHDAECYFYKGEKGDYDLSKIQLKDKTLGTIDPKINSDKNKNKDNKIVIDIPFKVNNSGDGYENIIIKEGTVKVGNLTNDKLSVQENDFYVDTTYPTVKWSTDQTQKYDSKTKTYYYEKGVKITATCTDTGSKMKSVTISGKGTNITNATISDSKKSATITNNVKGKNLEYKVVCADNAGNEKSYTNKYNVMEFSVDSSCPCKTYKSCETKDCGCKTGKRCPAAGCASGYYSYYWSDLRDSSSMQGSGGCIRCDSGCNYSCWNAYGSGGQGGRCTFINGKMYQGRCLRSYICSYNNRSYSKCGCEEWKTCEDDDCGCKTRKECWHY